MAERWARSGAAWKGDIASDQLEGYGSCPSCGRTMRILGGFRCDSCKLRVCEECIRKYREKYICLRCSTGLSRKEQQKVERADDLTNPLPSMLSRTFLWWIVLVLVLLPVFLAVAWPLYTAGQQGWALTVILLLIAFILYWNSESERWLGGMRA